MVYLRLWSHYCAFGASPFFGPYLVSLPLRIPLRSFVTVLHPATQDWNEDWLCFTNPFYKGLTHHGGGAKKKIRPVINPSFSLCYRPLQWLNVGYQKKMRFSLCCDWGRNNGKKPLISLLQLVLCLENTSWHLGVFHSTHRLAFSS